MPHVERAAPHSDDEQDEQHPKEGVHFEPKESADDEHGSRENQHCDRGG